MRTQTNPGEREGRMVMRQGVGESPAPANDHHPQIVGVIAGTPIDTEMGEKFFTLNQFEAIGEPLSATPEGQTQLQAMSRPELTELTITTARKLVNRGATVINLYCNSLSGSIDLVALRERVQVPVVTPYDAYASLLGKYRVYGILAANGQSVGNIERHLISSTKNSEIPLLVVMGNLKLVLEIERAYKENIAPAELLDKLRIMSLVEHMIACGAEVIMLACTHFTFFEQELRARLAGTNIEIFEPSEQMLKLVRQTFLH